MAEEFSATLDDVTGQFSLKILHLQEQAFHGMGLRQVIILQTSDLARLVSDDINLSCIAVSPGLDIHKVRSVGKD